MLEGYDADVEMVVCGLNTQKLDYTHNLDPSKVILATEARDESADSTFAQLHAEFGGAFLELFQTRHSLGPGEVAGKSSNERHACMELYSWAQARCPRASGGRRATTSRTSTAACS